MLHTEVVSQIFSTKRTVDINEILRIIYSLIYLKGNVVYFSMMLCKIINYFKSQIIKLEDCKGKCYEV